MSDAKRVLVGDEIGTREETIAGCSPLPVAGNHRKPKRRGLPVVLLCDSRLWEVKGIVGGPGLCASELAAGRRVAGFTMRR